MRLGQIKLGRFSIQLEIWLTRHHLPLFDFRFTLATKNKIIDFYSLKLRDTKWIVKRNDFSICNGQQVRIHIA